jgi:transposase
MSQKDLRRYDIIKEAIDSTLNSSEAAERLCVSARQVRRLKKRVKQQGARGVIHKNRGRTGNRRIPEAERKNIISLLHARYPDFGPTFASEKLEKEQGIIRDPKTIRQIMIDEGLWKPRTQKGKTNEHRQWRQPRSRYGEMVQFDGSYEYWFEDRAERCCLLLAIDDATGKVIHATFDTDEGVFPVFSFWKEYIERNGRPESIYLDKFSTYKMNRKFAQDNHDLKTQFQRAMEELKIDPITAHSPQAKGRVERVFETWQDRLIKEMRLQDISTKDAANQFLAQTYIGQHNEQFGKEPRKQGNRHTQLTKTEQKRLSSTLSRHTERTVNNDFTVSFNNTWYQITKDQPITVHKKEKITVEEWLDGTIHIRLRGRYLNYDILPDWAKRATGRKKQAEKTWVISTNTTNLGQAIGELSRQIVKERPHH